MTDGLHADFQKAEARALRLVAEAGFTGPDCVLPDFDPRNLILQWNEPDLVEVIVPRCESDSSVALPEALARAPASVGADMQDLIDRNDLPAPDIVRPGRDPGNVEFIWRDRKVIVIVSDEGIAIA